VAPLVEWALENMLESTQFIQMTAEQKELERNKLFAAADSNGDGVIEWDEFRKWFIPTARAILAQQRKAEQIKKQRRAQKTGRAGADDPPEVADKAVVVEEREET
jgi:hypothetical protein